MARARPEFSLSVSTEGDRSVIRVAGELDLATAPKLRAAVLDLLREQVIHVEVDLAELGFIDSSGLSVLVGALKRLREPGGDLRLRSVPPQAANVLRVTGLHQIFHIDPALG